MDRKFFFFDIDGTLTDIKTFEVVKSSVDAIRQLEKKGHVCALASGRAHFRAKQFAQENGFKNMICEGGNCIVIDDVMVVDDGLDQDLVSSIVKQAYGLGLSVAASFDDSDRRYTRDEEFLKRVGNTQPFMTVEIDELFDEHLKTLNVRRLFVEKDPEKIAQIPEVNLLGQYPMTTYDFTIFECDDKYRGIQRMVKMLGGDEKDVVVFGDGVNDCKMMKEAAFGIAMGNACDQLKEIADYVTADSTDDGIVKALKHFGWL
ncbi:MAG: HAD family phosphatase [Erysipelotrichaceae bacterium]|nr:HAD family phosphatase [Erysipelotrichaceae bacterium]